MEPSGESEGSKSSARFVVSLRSPVPSAFVM